MSDSIINHEEVLNDIYTFLSHYGYKHALLALQIESGVAYNVINVNDKTATLANANEPSLASNTKQTEMSNKANATTSNAPLSIGAFERCVLDGRYDELLSVYLANTLLPFEVKRNLYELIVEEMLQVHGLQPAAKALFQHAPVFAELKLTLPARYTRLEQTINMFDISTWEQAREHGTHINVNEIQSRRESVLSQLRQCIQFNSKPYQGRLEAALSLVHNTHATLHKQKSVEELKKETSTEDTETEMHVTNGATTPSTSLKRQRTEEDTDASDINSHPVNTDRNELTNSAIHALPYLTGAPNQIFRKLLFDADETVSSCAWATNVNINCSQNSNTETTATTSVTESAEIERKDHNLLNATSPSITAELHESVTPLCTEASHVLLTGKVNGVVDFVELESCHTIGNAVGHTSGVLCMCTDVASIERGNSNKKTTQVNSTSKITDVCTNTWVAVGYRDGWIKIYNTQSHRLIRRFESVHALGVTALAFTGAPYAADALSISRQSALFAAHRTILLSASFDSSICVMDVVTGNVLHRLAEAHHGASIRSLCDLTLPLMRNTFHGSAQTFHSHFYSAMDNTKVAASEESGGTQVANSEQLHMNANYTSDVVWPFISSGDDGLLNVWEFCDKLRIKEQYHLTRLSAPIPLQAIHSELKNEVPTSVQLLTLTFMQPALLHTHTESTMQMKLESNQRKAEVIILTRSSTALIVQIEITVGVNNTITSSEEWEENMQPLSWSVLALLNAPKPMRFATTHITHPVSMRVPMLSVFVSLNDGTICLYNIKMTWRDEYEWKRFNGSLVLHEPLDSSSVVVTDHGSAIADLHLLITSHKYESGKTVTPLLVVYSPSLPSVYLLR